MYLLCIIQTNKKFKIMKAIIENAVLFLEHDGMDYDMLVAFNTLLQIISRSKDEKDLRLQMSHISDSTHKVYFKWGFGGNHMWVHQNKIEADYNGTYINDSKRIIFVKFNQ